MNGEAQTRQLQRHMIEAFELWYGADPALGTQVAHVAGATAFRWPALPVPLFNRALGLGDELEPEDADVDRLIDLYREDPFPAYIQLSPLANRAALGRRLRDRGLQQTLSMATLAMSRDGEVPSAMDPAISIEPVDDRNADDFVQVLGAAFSLPPVYEPFLRASMALPQVENFLARLDGGPAGVGQIVVAAGVGGLYSGAVLERHRKRGVQSALISYRVRRAFDRGLRLLYSGTEEVDNQSSRNLRKQGFFLAYEIENWEVPGAPVTT